MARLPYLLFFTFLLTACTVPIQDVPPAQSQEQAALPPPEVQTAQADAVPPVEPVPSKSKTRRAAPRPKGDEPPVPPDLDRQPIEELVIRPEDLTGYWVLVAPRIIDVDVGIFSGVHIRYGGEPRDRNICWLEQRGRSLSALCASGTILKSGEGSVSDDGISMRWWMGAATANFSGKFTEAGKIAGGFSGGVVGISVTGDVPASLYKLDPPDPRPAPGRPSAALIRAVWEDVRQGHLTEGRYEGSAVKRVNRGMSRETAVETPRSMLFLGQILVRWRKNQRETIQDVYQVTTDKGRQLCRVAEDDEGLVVDFNCLALDRKN